MYFSLYNKSIALKWHTVQMKSLLIDDNGLPALRSEYKECWSAGTLYRKVANSQTL